jgi:hypothetical protein
MRVIAQNLRLSNLMKLLPRLVSSLTAFRDQTQRSRQCTNLLAGKEVEVDNATNRGTTMLGIKLALVTLRATVTVGFVLSLGCNYVVEGVKLPQPVRLWVHLSTANYGISSAYNSAFVPSNLAVATTRPTTFWPAITVTIWASTSIQQENNLRPQFEPQPQC